MPIPKPDQIVVDIADRTTEIRDLAISQAAVRPDAEAQ
jgi:hypothetical protein